MVPYFRDRADAGRRLARRLLPLAAIENAIVLGLPRGGVPIGYEIAKLLRLPFDVLVVRKLGVPGHEELAMGAIAGAGVRVLNHDVVDLLGVTPEAIEEVAARESLELARRNDLYRAGLPPQSFAGKVAIVADDGLATGSTMRAAIQALRRAGAAQVLVAVPVAARSTADDIALEADEVVSLVVPEPFHAVSLWYEDFEPVSDDDVRAILDRARATAEIAAAPVDRQRPRHA